MERSQTAQIDGVHAGLLFVVLFFICVMLVSVASHLNNISKALERAHPPPAATEKP